MIVIAGGRGRRRPAKRRPPEKPLGALAVLGGDRTEVGGCVGPELEPCVAVEPELPVESVELDAMDGVVAVSVELPLVSPRIWFEGVPNGD